MGTIVDQAGLQACDDSIRRPAAQIVDELRQALGARLVAYIRRRHGDPHGPGMGRDRPAAVMWT